MAKKPATSTSTPSAKDPAQWRIAIIHGKESFLRGQRTTELREALAKHFGGIDVLTFDGTTVSAAEVLDECRSFGLIAQHKMVIVEEAESLVKEDVRPLFERYAESPCEGATLVLRSSSWRAGKLDKLVEAVGGLIACEPMHDAEAQKWAVERAKAEHKVELKKEAAAMLVMRVGAELGKLDSELGKLAAAAGEGRAISVQLVTEFVGVSREEAVWGIQAALLTNGPEELLAHLRYILDVSRQPPVLVMYAMTDLARKIHAASRSLRQGGNAQSLKGPLKLWGPSVDPLLDAARRTHPDMALRLLRECVQSDARSKSGLGEVEIILERLVLRFAQLLGNAQPAGHAVGR